MARMRQSLWITWRCWYGNLERICGIFILGVRQSLNSQPSSTEWEIFMWGAKAGLRMNDLMNRFFPFSSSLHSVLWVSGSLDCFGPNITMILWTCSLKFLLRHLDLLLVCTWFTRKRSLHPIWSLFLPSTVTPSGDLNNKVDPPATLLDRVDASHSMPGEREWRVAQHGVTCH